MINDYTYAEIFQNYIETRKADGVDGLDFSFRTYR